MHVLERKWKALHAGHQVVNKGTVATSLLPALQFTKKTKAERPTTRLQRLASLPAQQIGLLDTAAKYP